MAYEDLTIYCNKSKVHISTLVICNNNREFIEAKKEVSKFKVHISLPKDEAWIDV